MRYFCLHCQNYHDIGHMAAHPNPTEIVRYRCSRRECVHMVVTRSKAAAALAAIDHEEWHTVTVKNLVRGYSSD